jgi:membrane-associated phospholipid phosphatase
MAFLALLTFVGSMLTGWHYAIDGYAGALLAWLCVLLAQRLEQVQGDTEPEPRHQPPAATRATDRATAE